LFFLSISVFTVKWFFLGVIFSPRVLFSVCRRILVLVVKLFAATIFVAILFVLKLIVVFVFIFILLIVILLVDLGAFFGA
jgi:hypothetical protein